MILIDLQKAFDTIDHEILLQKLKAIRFSKGTLQWFRSYLSERIFLVNIKGKLSDFGKISCGVPQGSILGPLLFLIYVNVCHRQSNKLYFYMQMIHASYTNTKKYMKLKNTLINTLKIFVTVCG